MQPTVHRTIITVAGIIAVASVPLTYYGVRCPWLAPAAPPVTPPAASVSETVPPPLPAPVGFETRRSWPYYSPEQE
jgi:hypothetical protein